MYVDIGDSIALQYGGSEAHKKVSTENSQSTIAGPIGKVCDEILPRFTMAPPYPHFAPLVCSTKSCSLPFEGTTATLLLTG